MPSSPMPGEPLMHNRCAEIAEIDRYLSARAPTRCRTAYATAVLAALPPRIEVERLAKITVEILSREENRERLRQAMWATQPGFRQGPNSI
jgi:hypothetical protein